MGHASSDIGPRRTSFVGRAVDAKTGSVSKPRLFGGVIGSIGMTRSIGAAAPHRGLPLLPAASCAAPSLSGCRLQQQRTGNERPLCCVPAGDRKAARACISTPDIRDVALPAGQPARLIVATDGVWDSI